MHTHDTVIILILFGILALIVIGNILNRIFEEYEWEKMMKENSKESDRSRNFRIYTDNFNFTFHFKKEKK